MTVLAPAPDAHGLFWSSFKKRVRKAFRRAKRKVSSFAKKVGGRVRSAARRVRRGLRRGWSRLRSAARRGWAGARSWLRRVAGKVKKGVKSAAARIKKGVKKLLVPLGSLGQTVSKAVRGLAATIKKHAIPTIVQTLRSLRSCKFKSFRRRVARAAAQTFTMIFASDTQFPWWGPVGGRKCANDDCVLKSSIAANRDQVRAMNGITQLGRWPANLGGNPITTPRGVVINGDLTAFAHTWQWHLFERHFNTKVGKGRDVLRLPGFYGLGNHDYSNNLRDCRGTVVNYLRFGTNACARFSVDYIKRMVNCGAVGNFDPRKVTSFDVRSLAYSWDVGGYHFVQLHLHPTYVVTDREVGISSAIPWLKQDLAEASRRGQKIVLNFHDAHERAALFSAPKREFLDAIRGQRVVAIFAGHIHSRWGRVGNVKGTSIPVFLSGSSDNRKFLLAEFGPRGFKVAVVDSAGGRPKLQGPSGSNRTVTSQIRY